MEVSKNHLYRVKRLGLKLVFGKHAEQYKYVYDYAESLVTWNPGSCVKIARNGVFFERMYVRLDACKRGFLSRCRPMISVDGCHLKGPLGGQLLCAVAKDANDDVYPLAVGIVEIECRASWTWFLSLLLEDMSDDDL